MPVSRNIAAASHILAAAAMVFVLWMHLLPALIAGLLVHALVGALAPKLGSRLSGERSRQLAVGLLAVVVAALVAVLIAGAIILLREQLHDPTALFNGLMPILDQARAKLPAWIAGNLPLTAEDLRVSVTDLLRRHSDRLRVAGQAGLLVTGRIAIGLALGALIALAHDRDGAPDRPLAAALRMRCTRMATAFRDIVFAQSRIAAINALLTAVLLLAVMPLAGAPLPFAKSLVAITFVVGLLPVVGNLISNTLIVIVALSVSLGAAIGALVFLIVLHKLEYFLNARIIGERIRARAWELLLAMLAMEAVFGLAGVVAAPILYAWVKAELKAVELI